jgi:hypothetical protein
MAFGGSSFGGIAALVAGMRGADKCGFGALLVESPSLWIGDPEPETFLKVRVVAWLLISRSLLLFLQEVLAYRCSWRSRSSIYLGMGGTEYSGTHAQQPLPSMLLMLTGCASNCTLQTLLNLLHPASAALQLQGLLA